jgi:hypothetical protein
MAHRLGDKAIGAITEDDLEALLVSLRTSGRAISTCNQYVQLLKASFRWAIRKGYISGHPVSADSEHIKRDKHAKRNRRLLPDRFDEHGNLVGAGRGTASPDRGGAKAAKSHHPGDRDVLPARRAPEPPVTRREP